eukprot:6211769-Pleurochrysis_carterae.AAC.5
MADRNGRSRCRLRALSWRATVAFVPVPSILKPELDLTRSHPKVDSKAPEAARQFASTYVECDVWNVLRPVRILSNA